MKRFFRSRADDADEEEESPRLTSRAFEAGVPPPERPGRTASVTTEHGTGLNWAHEPVHRHTGPATDPDGLAPMPVAGVDDLGPDGLVNAPQPESDYPESDHGEPDYAEPRFLPADYTELADLRGADEADPDGPHPDYGDLDHRLAEYPDPVDEFDAVDGPDRGVSSLRRRFESPLARSRVEARGERRTAWAYLALLTGMFCFLVVFGYACSDVRPDELTTNDPAAELVGGAAPSRLVFRVDGDVVAVQGAVPDQPAKDQLIALAQDVYGPENVVDDVTVDADTTLESGTVRFVGSAILGDERPEALQAAVTSTFGLDNRGFEVGFAETQRAPVDAGAAITGAAGGGATVVLSGALPNEQSITDLQTAAAEIWGIENVDGVALVVGDTTWTDGVLRLSGSTLPTDDRPAQFGALVRERIDAAITVDTSGLTIVDNSAQVDEVQAAVAALVTASPIQFAPDSPVISEESDTVLAEVAATLNQVPDVPFDVVGHTDDVGDEQDNLLLSEQRAEAVVARLAELGVDPARMSARGEGEANPIADNGTDEGKAANRRIEFVLVGTSSG